MIYLIFLEKIVIIKFFLFLFIIIAKYYPKEKSFNKEFLLGVLRGTKKLLPLGCFGDLICRIILKVKN